ncbi:protein-export chaperone SecB [Oscillatoria amoena NRMC-F 0135]|nr:protein-export chaperone SecB [Oscillatoria laete-virens]MDL5046545.1 protein-export chaperone SecB [Oscillatoria amoena NRMC-F 0135]MDL5054839.1 protein-export chaperone SecB [Oscillatoria laete-virens NRMC-F 0139]
MKQSPLILIGYSVLELSIRANPNFDSQKPVKMDLSEFAVDSLCTLVNPETNRWDVVLTLQHDVNQEKNQPYSFKLHLIGNFEVLKGYPEDKRTKLVEVNGPSILYGIAREIIRSTSAQGPFRSLLLPSVSFYPPKEKENLHEKSMP